MTDSAAVVLELVKAQSNFRYTSVAGATLTIYDHYLTLGAEVQLIWQRPWTAFTAIYILVRYFGDGVVLLCLYESLVDSPTSQLCKSNLEVTAWTCYFLSLLAQIILQCRVWALYGRSRKILILCATCFVLELGMTIFGITLVLRTVIFIVVPLGTLSHFCRATSIPTITNYFMLPIIAFELLLFMLALVECIRHIRQLVSTKQWNRNAVIKIIFRDSFIYFFVGMCLYVGMLLAGLFQSDDFAIPIPTSPAAAAQVIISTRLTLNLRAAFYGGNDDTVSEWGPAGSSGETGAANRPLEFRRAGTTARDVEEAE